jgi:uncharacterized membrane protein HdeD (DUF308 family)
MAQHAGRVPRGSMFGSGPRADIYADPATAETIKRSSWIPLLLGIWAVVFGVLTIVWPDATVLALAVIWGVFLVIAGPMQIAHALRMRAYAREWWLLLARGIATLALGVVALVWPDITVWALALILGVELLFLGVFETAAALQARQARRDWTWYLARGLVAIAIGIVTIAWPGVTVWALALLLGAFLIYFGILLIMGATTLRRSLHTVPS